MPDLENRRIDDLFNLQRETAEDIKELTRNVSSLARSVAVMAESNEHNKNMQEGFDRRLTETQHELGETKQEVKKIHSIVKDHSESLTTMKELRENVDRAGRFIEDQSGKDNRRKKIYWRLFDASVRVLVPVIAGVIGAAFVKFGAMIKV